MTTSSNTKEYNKAVFKIRNGIELSDSEFAAYIDKICDCEETTPSFCSAEAAVRSIASYRGADNKKLFSSLNSICDSTITIIEKWYDSLELETKGCFYFLTDKDYDLIEEYSGSGDVTFLDNWITYLKKGIDYIATNQDNKGLCVKACITMGVIILNIDLTLKEANL